MAMRHSEFLDKGVRLFGLSADSPGQNAAVMEKLALTFPILSDEDRQAAITPLGFADEKDPRQISRAGLVIIGPEGNILHREEGKDYADRPDEDDLIAILDELGLASTTQEEPKIGNPEPGEKAMPLEGIPHYFRGAKFAVLALRGRYRHLSDELQDDTKRYAQRMDRYIGAIAAARERNGGAG
jgi:hypothetical protein